MSKAWDTFKERTLPRSGAVIHVIAEEAWNAALATIDTPEMVERVAKAIFTDRNGKYDGNKFRRQMQPYIADAKAAIAAIKEELSHED